MGSREGIGVCVTLAHGAPIGISRNADITAIETREIETQYSSAIHTTAADRGPAETGQESRRYSAGTERTSNPINYSRSENC